MRALSSNLHKASVGQSGYSATSMPMLWRPCYDERTHDRVIAQLLPVRRSRTIWGFDLTMSEPSSIRLPAIPVSQAATQISDLITDGARVVFFCGAGVSMDHPAQAPDWIQLRDAIVADAMNCLLSASLCSPAEVHQLREEMMEVMSRQIHVKPELVLQWFFQVVGPRLLDALRILDAGAPNQNHNTLAALVHSGLITTIVTTNFDCYFERALDRLGCRYEVYASSFAVGNSLPFSALPHKRRNVPTILKPHGTLEEPSTIRITLRQVGRPLDPVLRDGLMCELEDSHLVIVGYSGNDYDIFPFLQGWSPKAKSVTWCVRDLTQVRSDIPALTPKIRIASGDLCELFERLSCLAGLKPTAQHSRAMPRACITEPRGIAIPQLTAQEASYALALVCLHIGAHSCADRVCVWAERAPESDRVFRSKLLNVRALVRKRADPVRSLQLYRQALLTLRPIADEHMTVMCNLCGNVGALLHECGKHRRALKWLLRSTGWARRGQSRLHVAQNCDDIGNCLRAMGNPNRAIRFHRRAERFHRLVGNLIGVALALNNEGLVYNDLQQFHAARHVLEESVDLKRREVADRPALTWVAVISFEVCVH